MKNSKARFTLGLALACAAITFSLPARAQAQTFTNLYSFCSQTNCADGDGVSAPLVQGTDGNLYGETVFGGSIGTSYCGSAGCGTIFKITPLTRVAIGTTSKVLDNGFDPHRSDNGYRLFGKAGL